MASKSSPPTSPEKPEMATLLSTPPKPRHPYQYAYQHHRSRQQLYHIYKGSLSRWFITVLFVMSIYLVLWKYSSKTVMDTQTKREFNGLVVGLSVGLSLSIASSLKGMVGDVKWWVLSLREWPVRQANLILQADSVSQTARLVWVSSSKSVRCYALTWVLVNFASQIGLAILGLTYSTNAANDITVTRPGPVSIPNMSSLETSRVVSSKSQALAALRYTANNYGNMALTWEWGDYGQIPVPGTLWDNEDPLIYCKLGQCRYVFQESTLDSIKNQLVVSTNRSVDVSSKCDAWPVKAGGDGSSRNITIDDEDETTMTLPSLYGSDQTTYMVDTETEQDLSWSIVHAFEASTSHPWYYRCNVSVSPVTNAILDQHKVGVNITSLAPSAIALQGYGASSQNNNTFQFQSYPSESAYGAPANGSTEDLGTLTAGFAAGMIAVTAQVNDNIQVRGMQPHKGVTLDISHWAYVHLTLGLTVTIQLLLAVLMGLLANRVVVRDDNHLSTAALLRPTLRNIDDRGLVADGNEIEALFGPAATLRYTQSKEGVYHVRLREGKIHHIRQ